MAQSPNSSLDNTPTSNNQKNISQTNFSLPTLSSNSSLKRAIITEVDPSQMEPINQNQENSKKKKKSRHVPYNNNNKENRRVTRSMSLNNNTPTPQNFSQSHADYSSASENETNSLKISSEISSDDMEDMEDIDSMFPLINKSPQKNQTTSTQIKNTPNLTILGNNKEKNNEWITITSKTSHKAWIKASILPQESTQEKINTIIKHLAHIPGYVSTKSIPFNSESFIQISFDSQKGLDQALQISIHDQHFSNTKPNHETNQFINNIIALRDVPLNTEESLIRSTNFSDNTRSPTLRPWNQTNLNNSHNTPTDNSLNSISSIRNAVTSLRNDVNNIMAKFQQLDSKLDKILNTLTTQTPSSKTSTHTQFDDTTTSHNHNDNINDMFMQNDELIDNTIITPHKTLHFDKLINQLHQKDVTINELTNQNKQLYESYNTLSERLLQLEQNINN
ncbi:8748_t:CDS:2, partial [Ambispora gerdemannii]